MDPTLDSLVCARTDQSVAELSRFTPPEEIFAARERELAMLDEQFKLVCGAGAAGLARGRSAVVEVTGLSGSGKSKVLILLVLLLTHCHD